MNAQEMNSWMLFGGGWICGGSCIPNLICIRFGRQHRRANGQVQPEINSLADFKGLKMRIPGLGGKYCPRLAERRSTFGRGDQPAWNEA